MPVNKLPGFRICSHAALFIMLSVGAFAQAPAVSNFSDTSKLYDIKYPPLTEREGKGLKLPEPPQAHPRLYLNKQVIPALLEKMENPVTQNLWNKILQSSNFKTDGVLEANVKDNYTSNLKIRNAIESNALVYALTHNQEAGKEAVTGVLNFYKTLIMDLTKNDYCRDLGRVIVTGSMVYDWCYDLLSKEDKAFLISHMENMAARMEIKWPGLVQGSVTSHGTEAQVARDMLSCGIATYNEKPEIYRLAAGRLMAEFIEIRNYFYPGDYHHQGSGYGPYRYSWDLYSTLIFDRMGYPNFYGKGQAQIPYIWIYTRRPDGQLLRNGDDFDDNFFNFGQYWSNTWIANAYAGSYFKDPILMGQAQKDAQMGKSYDYIFDFLFYDPKAPVDTNQNKLPLTRYFKEPFGAMVARTGWHSGNSSNDVVAEMKVVTRNFANHEHLDAGSFQLYYRGPLTVQSGIYQGQMGSYGGPHFVNYSQRTIAHNSMLIYDPNEVFKYYGKPILNDGGQRTPNNYKEPENLKELMKDEYATGDVLAHQFGPDALKPEYSYLKGELKKAYSAKVQSFKRSFLFLNFMDEKNPAAMLVYDVVTASDKSFKKYWLLHSVGEPQISGKETVIRLTEKGYSGKLVNTTLYPLADNLQINKIGGKDNAYNVFGKNFPQLPNNPEKSAADGAIWRIEVSPKNASETDRFLNVMQVMDGNTEVKALTVESISSELFTGAVIKDRIALFSKTGNVIGQNITLTIPGTEKKKLFIADVQDGNWQVLNATTGKPLIALVKAKDQVLYFSAKPGKLLIKKKL